MEKTIAFVLFPEVTILDLVGPLAVLENLAAPYRSIVVAARVEPTPTEGPLVVQAQATFESLPEPFAFVIPGGPGALQAMADDAIQRYVTQSAAKAEVVGSVCTGSLVLAAAGLLDGRRATTHWAYAGELEALGAHYVRQRWVEDGKFITAAGVASGIDMAIALAARLTDEATAKRIQLGIEYDPQPPFGGIDWNGVGATERRRQREGGTGKRLATGAAEIFARRPDLLDKLRGVKSDT
jgi:transcriptional regulator GlxA family with amidase domain